MIILGYKMKMWIMKIRMIMLTMKRIMIKTMVMMMRTMRTMMTGLYPPTIFPHCVPFPLPENESTVS